jgi:hypothetical protein
MMRRFWLRLFPWETRVCRHCRLMRLEARDVECRCEWAWKECAND